ncbi:hypothetical protein POPTR_019G066100v4 [Populus trichocarpa]|uniref:Uncharacterized protein n=1 Tax=Populus trichocarpa TaxID=3694 RepID=A0ACC0RJL4_POPTR|nr:hypothetical protein BDE02_19G063700 [Populus trichocarpa]KAI9377458.1 hypothetical protein POPTR_019G066100v4 [Populus trichocarpa]
MSIIKNNVSTGSSLWQPQHGIASANELQGWRTVASRLAFDSQLRKMEENQCANEDGCYRKSLFSTDISVRNPAAKMKQYPFDRQQEQLGNSKWYSYKTLPPAELLPRNEVMGGYIFVCNNETMQEDLRRQLFGLPHKYRDSVRAITPGLPLFLYNYTCHQLHGVFQVRIGFKKKCKPLEEDAFRPILYHYDGPKFRLQLSVPEALALLDLFNQKEL